MWESILRPREQVLEEINKEFWLSVGWEYKYSEAKLEMRWYEPTPEDGQSPHNWLAPPTENVMSDSRTRNTVRLLLLENVFDEEYFIEIIEKHYGLDDSVDRTCYTIKMMRTPIYVLVKAYFTCMSRWNPDWDPVFEELMKGQNNV